MLPSEIAALTSIVTVCTGFLFGALTILQWRRTRYLSAAAELVRSMQTAEFSRAIDRVMLLPENASLDAVQADPATLSSVHLVAHVFESLGVLVFHRLLPLHLVDHLLGGYVRASWRRLGPYAVAHRPVVGAMFCEWFQWLNDRLEQDPAPGKHLGAWIAHRAWRP